MNRIEMISDLEALGTELVLEVGHFDMTAEDVQAKAGQVIRIRRIIESLKEECHEFNKGNTEIIF